MADYYPLISRAVAGLDKNNGENRRALYERARAALIAQLRGVTPALPESDITRERLALEESIRKVEAEAARQFDPVRGQGARPRMPEPEEEEEPRAPAFVPQPPPRPAAPQMPRMRPNELDRNRWDEPPPVPPPSRPSMPYQGRGDSPPAPRRGGPPLMPGGQYNDSIYDHPTAPEPLPEPPPPPPLPRHPLRRPMGDRRQEPGLHDVIGEASAFGGAATRMAPSMRDAFPPGPADYDRRDPRLFDRQDQDHDLRPLPAEFQEPMLEPSITADEARPSPHRSARQLPPQPPPPVVEDTEAGERSLRAKRTLRDLAKGAAALVVVAALGGVLLWQWPSIVALYQKVRTPAVVEVRETTPAQTSRSNKITDRIEPGVQPSQDAQAAIPGTGVGAAVAQKVVLYEEDPADPNGKRFVGSAIWRTETVSPGPGQPPELAIRADVDIPDRKLAMTWSLRRNTDKTLPASHTVEISFKLPGDFPSGGISNVPGILMKQAEQTRGVPLAGLAVKVTTGFFLIGLSASDADRDRNLQLLKERAWFDIPVVYNNNRRAILAIEKGTPGERVFAEAFKAWKQ